VALSSLAPETLLAEALETSSYRLARLLAAPLGEFASKLASAMVLVAPWSSLAVVHLLWTGGKSFSEAVLPQVPERAAIWNYPVALLLNSLVEQSIF
jgi:hypothetical protein